MNPGTVTDPALRAVLDVLTGQPLPETVWTVPGLSRCLAWFPGRGWLDPTDHWAAA
jgi:hypothetical protein